MVTGKSENVTQMPSYYHAQKSGSKHNKSNLSFNLSCEFQVSVILSGG